MKILYLAKRVSTGRDILQSRSGRLYELPAVLAALGHDVLGICFSYHRGLDVPDNDGDPVHWRVHGLDQTAILGAAKYLRDLGSTVRSFRPDIIFGASDSLHALIAALLARRYRLPYLLDLYDNFESFGLTRLPFLKHGLRFAVRNAAAVSVVSDELAEYVRREYGPKGAVSVVENAVPEGRFRSEDKREARKRFNLPLSGPIVGTAGALEANRGIRTLYESFLAVASANENVHLAVAGRTDTKAPIPRHPRIRYLGEIAYERVPSFLSCLDVGVVCNRADDFGSYCFPQKLYEMLACGLPVIAANVGVMGRVFEKFPGNLYEPGDARSLEIALTRQLESPTSIDMPVPTWNDQGAKLDLLINTLVI